MYALIGMNIMSAGMMSMNESPLIMWILMEISNIMFITAFTLMQSSYNNTPALILLIQFFSSAMILVSILQKMEMMMSLGILMKLGMYPTHTWMPMVIILSPWKSNILLMTLPKIQPFLFMEMLPSFTLLLISTSVTSLIMTIKLIKTNNSKIILALSSIMNSGWMTLAQKISTKSWMLYFSLYSTNIFMVCSFLSTPALTYYKMNLMMKVKLMLAMFSMMGAPPITMFSGKLYVTAISNYMILIPLLIMMTSSAVSLLYYSRIFMQTMFLHKMVAKPLPPPYNFTKIKWLIFILFTFVTI